MKYILYVFFVIGLSFVFIGVTTILNQPASYIPKVEDGVIDLTNIKNLDSTVVNLDGEWDFYWETFLHTDEKKQATYANKKSIAVPSSWEVADIEGENISNLGYGTYELKIIIPDELVEKSFGLYISNVATSYKLWINDELIIANGTIGTSASEMVPVNYARTAYFQPDDKEIDITIEVANFSQRKGGLWESIQFGSANEISLLRDKNIALQLLVVGSLIIMGLYNIFIFILRRRLLYTMFLGILCLIFGVRTLLVGETFFLSLFPNFQWELQVKLEYLPTVFGLLILVKYIHELYKENKFIIFERIVMILSLLFAAIVLFTPAIVYTKYLLLFLIVVPIAVIYFGYLFLKAYFEKRPAALFTLIAFTIFIITAINDSFYFLNVTNNGTYLSTGFFIFILSQTFAHAIQFSQTHYQVEKLSEQLLEINRSLEKKVEERTKALSLLNEKLRKSEHERKSLMSDLAHEISKPLTLIKGYSEAMVDEKLLPQKEFLQIIHHNANISERLIQDLSELSKLETRQLEMIFQKVTMKNYPNNILQHHRFIVENQGKELTWTNKEHWLSHVPENAYIYIDPDRMNQVFINIIENALQYAESGKNIYLEAEFNKKAIDDRENILLNNANQPFEGEKIGEFIIKMIDEGKGIPKEDIPYIFIRMYRGANYQEGINNRGLGLAISKEIVEMHGGKIWAESEHGRGSTFYISLPVFRN